MGSFLSIPLHAVLNDPASEWPSTKEALTHTLSDDRARVLVEKMQQVRIYDMHVRIFSRLANCTLLCAEVYSLFCWGTNSPEFVLYAQSTYCVKQRASDVLMQTFLSLIDRVSHHKSYNSRFLRNTTEWPRTVGSSISATSRQRSTVESTCGLAEIIVFLTGAIPHASGADSRVANLL